ncbi:hypothetical protein MCACP_21460 [Neomoorella carbonis]
MSNSKIPRGEDVYRGVNKPSGRRFFKAPKTMAFLYSSLTTAAIYPGPFRCSPPCLIRSFSSSRILKNSGELIIQAGAFSYSLCIVPVVEPGWEYIPGDRNSLTTKVITNCRAAGAWFLICSKTWQEPGPGEFPGDLSCRELHYKGGVIAGKRKAATASIEKTSKRRWRP